MKKISSNIKPLISKIIFSFLIIIGFLYRIYGLNNNHSFWTDENHVAIFARAILERGKPILLNDYSTDTYQWLQYWLSAISARIFGLNEFAIRFPSVIFGILTIWAVYLLAKELFDKNVALLSAFLITFSKIEILWSRQARPYQALQLFFILGAWFLYKLTKEEKFNWRYSLGFLCCSIFASLMHGLGVVIFFIGFIYFLIFKASWFKKKWMLLGVFLFVLFSWVFKIQIFSIVSRIGDANTLFYYRIFLTHNYLPLCILTFLGFFLLFRQKNYRELVLFFIFLGGQLIIDSFLIGKTFVRYFYPTFPFLILLSAFSLLEISKYFVSFLERPKYLVLFIKYIVLFILVFLVMNFGYKFTFWPQQSYSLNEDMQEIPEVDWKKIYNFVGEKLNNNHDSILIANWNDLPIWYLGEGSLDYLLREENPFTKNTFIGIQDTLSESKLIFNLTEMKRIITKEKRGLVVIDSWDDRIPDGVREYIKNNLKKELEIDRLYSIQPRYWPVEVYSWGF